MEAKLELIVKKLRVQVDLLSLLLYIVPLMVLLTFFVAPIASIFTGLAYFDWSLLTSPFYVNLKPVGAPFEIRSIDGVTLVIVKGVDMGIILNSIINSFLVTFFATIIGTSVALLVGLYDFPGRRIFAILASLPLLVAPFVNAYVIKLLYGFNLQGNTISYILRSLGIPLEIGFTGLAGVTVAQTLAFYPIVYINVLAALGSIDATLIEQALNLGSRGFRLVRTIILPLVFPGILAGATLVYILSLEDVGAP
ncbi:MAG TPA: iron ABC transporter permease, partial [Pyrodictium sp.]|nr:iron ABC transporter permease [Pyrodictium sp.]